MKTNFYTSYEVNDSFKRTSIVIISSDFETKENSIGKRANFDINDDYNFILGILEDRYNATSNDSLPYHYIITRDGIVHDIKAPLLTVPSKSALSLYENDCLVLVLCHELSTATENQIDSLTRLISNLSSKISVKIMDSIFYPENFVRNNEDKKIKKEMLKHAISVRNKKEPILSVLEYVLPNGDILENDLLEMITTSQSDATLKTIAAQFGLSEQTLLTLNPGLWGFVSNQHIFIPSTPAIKAMREGIKSHKYLYSLSFLSSQILREGLEDE